MAPTTNNLPAGISIEEQPLTSIPQTVSRSFSVVEPGSVSGIGKVKYTAAEISFERRLYRVEGSSIKWIAVLLPKSLYLEPIPLIFFMPQPGNDPALLASDFDGFKGKWPELFRAYTYYIGGQLAAASQCQGALVMPFYADSQAANLGNFNVHWQPIVREILTDALMKKDPLIIRGDQTSFKNIMTAGYSSGVVVHKHFHAKGADVESMTSRLYSLDGKIGPSHWEDWSFSGSIVYKDQEARMPNPRGNVYYLANRWFVDDPAQRESQKMSLNLRKVTSHWMPAQFMLYHGLKVHPPA